MSRLFDRARKLAIDAEWLFERGSYESVCNRAYFAMFSAARALLTVRGYDPQRIKRHATVLQQFSLEFVRDGPFDAEDGRALGKSGVARRRADYEDAEIDEEQARAVLASLKKFMAKAERVIAQEELKR